MLLLNKLDVKLGKFLSHILSPTLHMTNFCSLHGHA